MRRHPVRSLRAVRIGSVLPLHTLPTTQRNRRLGERPYRAGVVRDRPGRGAPAVVGTRRPSASERSTTTPVSAPNGASSSPTPHRGRRSTTTGFPVTSAALPDASLRQWPSSERRPWRWLRPYYQAAASAHTSCPDGWARVRASGVRSTTRPERLSTATVCPSLDEANSQSPFHFRLVCHPLVVCPTL